MASLLVLGADELRGLLDLDELAGALEAALVAISAGEASVPPRIAAHTGHGLLGAMPGYAAGCGLGAKLVSVFPENASRELPSHQALVVLFDEEDGTPLALLDGTYLTAVRTAMTAAVAARVLARPESATVAVLGAGVQGESHLECFTHLFPSVEVRIASRRLERAEALAGTHPSARAVETFEGATRGADIVCCCTDARESVLDDGWIADGAHVGSVGSGRELPPALVERAEVFVESQVVLQPPPAGALELQGRNPASFSEVGAVLSGAAAGRSGPRAVTVYKSTGHALEDLAAAALAVRRARNAGVGSTLTLS